MNKNKKNILISWPAHLFKENIPPIINNIIKEYDIYYITVDYDTPKYLINELKKLKNNNLIVNYYFLTEYPKLLNHFYDLKKLLPLKKINFDVWLTMGEIEVHQKFIKNNLLSNNCKKIVLYTHITYLFENTSLTMNLINKNNHIIVKEKIKIKKNSLFVKFYQKIITFNFKIIFKGIYYLIYNRYKRYKRNLKYKFIELQAKILYRIYFGKKLQKGKFDTLTQMSSGEMDYILFCDFKEVIAHSELFKNTNIELVNHTGRGSCRCKNRNKKFKNILTPLSAPNNVDVIPQHELDQYLYAFKLAKKEVDFNEIHLRPHPREKGNWPHFLSNFLNENNINSKVVDSTDPIYKIICDYIGVIGEATCVLRDAANSCLNCFVIGLEKLSLHRYENPKFVFGEGQNIDWINENGDYDPIIFKERKKNYYENEKSIYDFLFFDKEKLNGKKK